MAKDQKIISKDSIGYIKSSYQGGRTGEVLPDIYVREPFSRQDYEWSRPNEELPEKFGDKLTACRSMYKKIGVVRNVVDLMIDFIVSGIKLQHEDLETDIFFKTWFKKIKVADAAAEFAKHTIIDCNTVVRRNTGRLTKPVKTQWMETAGSLDVKLNVEKNKTVSAEIPVGYRFLDICGLKWKNEENMSLTGEKILLCKIPKRLIEMVMLPKDQYEKDVVSKLPADFIQRVKNNKGGYIELDMSKVYVCHNKKDDWEGWATPYLISILGDIIYKQKMRQAETSALDGWVNVIRLWKLGDHEKEIFAQPEAFRKLTEAIQANTGGGALDIIWDSMIDMEEFYPPTDKILGSEKYVQVNADILIGLGVPEVLLGGRGANFSNSFIQLKTIVERLENVRNKIKDWLLGEVDLICRSMGFDTLPKIMFNHMNLQDENVLRKLMVGLVDRGLISPETVVQLHNEDFEAEMNKKDRNLKRMGVDEVPGPYSNQNDQASLPAGRPANQPTTEKRKPASNTSIRTKGSYLIKASEFIKSFDETVLPEFLAKNGIKNLRQLTNEQKTEIQNLRRSALSCISSLEQLDEKHDFANIKADEDRLEEINATINAMSKEFDRQLTIEEIKQLESVAIIGILEEKTR
jgi:hypothetical protein